MPKLRDTDDLDVEALEAVEYSTEKFSDYTGEVPPIGLVLTGYVKRMWWCRSANDDPMLKVLWIADGNEGDLEQYNGCPFWLNASLIPSAKFRWDPFLQAYGLTLTEVKTKTYVAKEEDDKGFIIERIGTWKPGADRDEAWAQIVTGQELYLGRTQAIADEWLAWDEEPGAIADEEPEDEEEVDEPDEEEPDEEEEPEDEDEDEDEDEEPEEPEPPARTRRASSARSAPRSSRAAPATAPRTARTASKTATAKTGARTRAGTAKAAPARTARAAATPGRAAKSPARSTRTKRAGTDNEPPF